MKTYSVTGLWLLLLFAPCISTGQVPINTVSTISNVSVSGGTALQTITSHSGSVNGITPSTSYTVGYTNTGNISITDFSYSGKTYVRYSFFDTVIVRRVANSSETTNGNKQHIYCQGTASVDNIGHTMPFPVAYPQVSGYNFMQRVMKEGYINRGSDNVFNNDASSDLTYNNIERVDFVFKTGLSAEVASSAGFLIAERGGNDPFKIAAILSIDANGNPTQFGSVLSVTPSSYGATIASAATYVMRKDASDNTLRPFSHVSSQSIKSVLVRFSDLGVANKFVIYGYALMANDVTATTSTQLLNFTNSTYFPLNTTTANGGMDMASAPGVFHTDMVLAVKFLPLKALTKNGQQQLNWKDDEFERVKEYQLEKSFDGIHFDQLSAITAQPTADYSFTDKKFTASAYYRLRVQEKNGNHYYSSVAFAKHTSPVTTVSLYPNPAKNYLNVAFSGHTGMEEIVLVAVDGKVHGKWVNSMNSRSMQIDIQNLPSGNYFLKISEGGNQPIAYQFVKQ